jgi:RHH-type proline utilization regulon transcriptional repressor/proline dehydrogenase/delta 1-pyrroline-5-carboxylate dehydrogenase
LLAACPPEPDLPRGPLPQPLEALLTWLRAQGRTELAARCEAQAAPARIGIKVELPGPVGERNLYALQPRGVVFCDAATADALVQQVAACLATGNRVLVAQPPRDMPPAIAACIGVGDIPRADAVLTDADGAALTGLLRRVAGAEGPIRPVLRLSATGGAVPLDMLVLERSVSTNTAAAGGNASLMSL